jgi:4'-phosphopantetheinyl transferase EntD
MDPENQDLPPAATRRLKPALLAELLPENISCALETLPGRSSDHPANFTHAEEAAEIASAVPKRQREYATGRRLARELLTAAGAPPAPLLQGPDRAPLWPNGFTGSITHTDDLCAVAICPTSAHTAIGIDVESAAPLKAKLWDSILVPSESDRFRVLGEQGAVLAKAHFSAKEAVYKLIAAEFGRIVGFTEVELRFSLMKNTFTAHGGATPKEQARMEQVRGMWRITPRHVITTAVWG